jgi:hypothetical protein
MQERGGGAVAADGDERMAAMILVGVVNETSVLIEGPRGARLEPEWLERGLELIDASAGTTPTGVRIGDDSHPGAGCRIEGGHEIAAPLARRDGVVVRGDEAGRGEVNELGLELRLGCNIGV